MRTTVRVDHDIMEQLKVRASEEGISITRMLNRALRAGLEADGRRARRKTLYRERTHAMGAPRVSLDRALALSAALEDEAYVGELLGQR